MVLSRHENMVNEYGRTPYEPMKIKGVSVAVVTFVSYLFYFVTYFLLYIFFPNLTEMRD